MHISSYSQSANMRANIAQLQTQLADLQRQLSTGLKADSFSKLGDARNLVLALNDQVARSNSYLDTINTTQLRIEASSNALTRLDAIAAEMKTGGLATGFELVSSGQTNLQITAGMRLDEMVSLLNLNVADRQLFGGRDTQTAPVALPDLILNGDTGHAGLRQVISERNQADLGDGLGRLALSSPMAGTVSLAEDVAGSPFGFKLQTAGSTLSGATVTGPAGSPATVSVAFGAPLPGEGEWISFDMKLPDGTSTTITLTATSSSPAGQGQFTIGADAATTAVNFQAALDNAVRAEAKTTLTAASTVQAGNEFFDYDPANPPQRVDGPPFATATGLRDATQADTVFWYRGDGSLPAGNNFIATIGDGQQLAYGARADQSGIRTAVKSVALLSAVQYTGTDAAEAASYAALTQRTSSALAFQGTQSVANIVTDLGLKAATLDQTKTNLDTQISTSKTLLSDTQNADPYEVATKLSSLLTQLQASYQVTSSLSKLSLVNYL